MNNLELYNSDCRHMSELADNSVHCIITSPPYFGLRRYAGLPDSVWNGDDKCEHVWNKDFTQHRADVPWVATNIGSNVNGQDNNPSDKAICSLCGAWKGQLGNEPDVSSYISHLMQIMGEMRRVLRPDGVAFININDSYAGSGGAHEPYHATPGISKSSQRDGVPRVKRNGKRGKALSDLGQRDSPCENLCDECVKMWLRRTSGKAYDSFAYQYYTIQSRPKAKDLCLVPERFVLACQEQGWWVRSRILWYKKSCMPESCKDRPTEDYEFIYLLTKSPKYFYDGEAVKERAARDWADCGGSLLGQTGWATDAGRNDDTRKSGTDADTNSRNCRTVWSFPSGGKPAYLKGHYATFPEALPERCIKAGTSEYGVCSKCGKQYERIIEKKRANPQRQNWNFQKGAEGRSDYSEAGGWYDAETKTTGWRQACSCKDAEVVGATVLDPFAGTGTTLFVARKMGRQAVGYELSPAYIKLIEKRNSQGVIL